MKKQSKKQSFKERSIELMLKHLGRVILDEPLHNVNKGKRENS